MLVGGAVVFLAWPLVGLTGGVPLSPFIQDTVLVDSAPRRYTVGPSIEWPLARGWSIESGFLYKRFGLDTALDGDFRSFPRLDTRSTTHGNAWEVPLLIRSRFRLSGGTAFTLGGGAAARFLTGVHESGTRVLSNYWDQPGRREVSSFRSRRPDRTPMVGAAFDAGLDIPLARNLRLSPRFRYIRWDSERSSIEPSAVRFERNQMEVLLTTSVALPGGRPNAAAFPSWIEPGALLANGAAGAFADWRIHERWSIETGVLTQRVEASTRSENPPAVFLTEAEGRQWSIAVIPRLRAWSRGRWSATLGAGPALRAASDVVQRAGAPGFLFEFDGRSLVRTTLGAATAAGLEVRARSVRLRPEVRWTWFPDRFYPSFAGKTPRSRLQAVLGVSWARAQH